MTTTEHIVGKLFSARWALAIMVGIVFVVGSVTGFFTAEFSGGVIGTVIGFYFGARTANGATDIRKGS
jgi:uncharacterized membrane protein